MMSLPVLGSGLDTKPLVSIGMPTYNSARFVEDSIAALRAQEYSNVELIISDDGSTDATPSICEAAARDDPRITFIAGPHAGERHNFNVVLRRATGEYFMWAADHDLWDPRYVLDCVEALERDPGAVLAYARSQLIDARGRYVEDMNDHLEVTADRASRRYRRLIWDLNNCNAIYGVVRRRVLQSTGGYSRHPSPDHLVLAKLAIAGRFIQIPKMMYSRRENRPNYSVEHQRRRQAMDLDPNNVPAWTDPPPGYFRGLRDAHLQAVLRADWSLWDKSLAVLATLYCFYIRFEVGPRYLALLGLKWQIRAFRSRLRSAISRHARYRRRADGPYRPEFTGERVVLGRGDRWWRDARAVEHMTRYQFALRHLRAGMRVIDVASGTGFGAALLATDGRRVTGYDIDAEAVAFAQGEWPEAEFMVADATALPDADGSVDAVTSFETIEHVADPTAFVAEIARVLKPTGLLILSTPNRPVFAKRSGRSGPNPYHVSEMDRAELANELDRWFDVEWFGQTRYAPRRHILGYIGDVVTLVRTATPETAASPYRVLPLNGPDWVFFVVVARLREAQLLRTVGDRDNGGNS